MALVSTDWSITRSTGAIEYIGGDHDGSGGTPSYATVIEFHRWLGDLADDASSTPDDELDITDELPSARSTDNIIKLLGIYNIDTVGAEHLYDGSIIQGSGGTEEIWDGIVNFGNADVQIQIHQNGAVLADDWWNFSGAGLNADSLQGISHRFMVKVRDIGADIDGRRLIGTTREFNKTYGEFPINGTSRGNNVFALANSDDLNNTTIEGTVSGWTNIVNTNEGYTLLDIDNTGVDEEYYSEWDIDAQSINDFYERMKWLTRAGSVSTIYGLNGELFRGITHEIAYDTQDASEFFTEGELLTFGNGATGQLFADTEAGVDQGTTGTLWIQLLTGSAPTATDSIAGATCNAVVATVTDRSALLSYPFVGASTGSALIGSYGLGLQVSDVLASDKLFDLGNNPITPPNNVTFTVSGLISGEDRILVAPWDGSAVDNEGNPAINEFQMSLNVTLATDNVTTVEIGHANGDVTAIPSDTPPTGWIRVKDDNGFNHSLHYSSWSSASDQFTIDSLDGQEDFLGVNATAGVSVYVAYLDTLATIYTVSTLLDQASTTEVVVSPPIDANLSASGNIDIELNNGTILTVAYSSFTGSTFTITSTDFDVNNASVGQGVWDDNYIASTSESFTGVYDVDRDLVVIARDGGGSPIKQFISSSKFVSSNSGISVIRTSDE